MATCSGCCAANVDVDELTPPVAVTMQDVDPPPVEVAPNSVTMQESQYVVAPCVGDCHEHGERATISDGKFVLGGEEVRFAGANYVYKAPPWFPPAEVVRQDAQAMGRAASVYRSEPDENGQVIKYKAAVRLGATWEAAMPTADGKIDAKFAEHLERTIEEFKAQGVYVFLDNHQDNMCTVFGGQGAPWWVGDHFQKTAGCGCSAPCSCCWGCDSGPWCSPAYVTSPDYPLKNMCGNHCSCCTKLLKDFTRADFVIRSASDDPSAPEEHRKNPWKAFAVGQNSGDPARMNLGNPSLRMNNNDNGQNKGSLQFSLQCQNFAYRLWKSPFNRVDRKAIFEPFVEFIVFLCRLWEKHWNIAGVEPFNEPNVGGLPDLISALRCERNYVSFWGELLTALDRASPTIEAPLAFEFIGGTVPGSSTLRKLVECVPWPASVKEQLRRRARAGKLILSFHYYQSVVVTVDFPTLVKHAQDAADMLGGCPTWLSEGGNFKDALEAGVNAVTYWHWVNLDLCPQGCWVQYPGDSDAFSDGGNVIEWKNWERYAETVRNGTFYGGWINGAGGGRENILGDGLP